MKESYVEVLAKHRGPESCADVCKDIGEALTRVHAGRVLSSENKQNQGADTVIYAGKQYTRMRNGKHLCNPAESKTSSMYENSMRENREAPTFPSKQGRISEVLCRS